MKSIVTTAALFLLFTFSATFAQQAPTSDAKNVGSSFLDLNILSAPQPDLTYSTSESDGSPISIEGGYWLVSGGEIVITADGDPLKPWAEQDPMYHNATESYVADKAGAMIVWTAVEQGVDLNWESTRVIFQKEDGSKAVRFYNVKSNGENVEVSLIGTAGKY